MKPDFLFFSGPCLTRPESWAEKHRPYPTRGWPDSLVADPTSYGFILSCNLYYVYRTHFFYMCSCTSACWAGLHVGRLGCCVFFFSFLQVVRPDRRLKWQPIHDPDFCTGQKTGLCTFQVGFFWAGQFGFVGSGGP